MADDKRADVNISKIVDVALNSGLIDAKVTLPEMVRKIGSGIDEVAGYVAAWDRYVLVVASNPGADVIIRQAGR